MKKTSSEVVRKVLLVEIDGPIVDQRIEIDQESIEELAASIKEVGLMQPILITPKNGRFEVVWGNRRFLAHKFLGKTTILAKIQTLTKSQKIIMRATENLFREGISPIEEAYIYLSLREEEGMTNDQIASRMKKSVGIVRRRLDMLRMPECLQKAVHKGEINYAVAEDLWGLGDVSGIEYYLQFAIAHGATSQVVRQWVKDEKDKIRREKSGVVDGGVELSVHEEVPHYIACQLCKSPTELGKETVLRICPSCTKGIMAAMKGEENNG